MGSLSLYKRYMTFLSLTQESSCFMLHSLPFFTVVVSIRSYPFLLKQFPRGAMAMQVRYILCWTAYLQLNTSQFLFPWTQGDQIIADSFLAQCVSCQLSQFSQNYFLVHPAMAYAQYCQSQDFQQIFCFICNALPKWGIDSLSSELISFQ